MSGQFAGELVLNTISSGWQGERDCPNRHTPVWRGSSRRGTRGRLSTVGSSVPSARIGMRSCFAALHRASRKTLAECWVYIGGAGSSFSQHSYRFLSGVSCRFDLFFFLVVLIWLARQAATLSRMSDARMTG